MPVDSTHPEYDKACKKWCLVRSVVDNNAQKWIRTVDMADPVRSEQYKQDAILTNFTRLTKIGLTGLVFRREATIDLPPQLQYLEDDATGYNFGLEQLAQQVIGEILTTGRYGLLVDYPTENNANNVARIKPYLAESIINWKYKEIGSEYKLSLLVLKECVDDTSDDGFEWVEKIQYRVLMLDKDNVYHQVIYNELGEITDGHTPVDYHGNPLNEIPFTFVGSENNDACMDSIPLYDLAVVNLGHYRNSADYEESIFVTGQPFIVINLGETNEDEFRQANPNGIRFGSRAGLTVGMGGSAQLLQANPNQLADTAMKRKEEQAAAIGARLIAPPGGRETAEAARIRFGSQNSALYTITKNVSLAFEMCLEFVALFMMEVPQDSEFELNDQFYEEDADPNLIAQEIMLLQAGAMTVEEVRTNLGKSGIELDDEAILPQPAQVQQALPKPINDNNPEGNNNGSAND